MQGAITIMNEYLSCARIQSKTVCMFVILHHEDDSSETMQTLIKYQIQVIYSFKRSVHQFACMLNAYNEHCSQTATQLMHAVSESSRNSNTLSINQTNKVLQFEINCRSRIMTDLNLVANFDSFHPIEPCIMCLMMGRRSIDRLEIMHGETMFVYMLYTCR
jgi:hypothetical protein